MFPAARALLADAIDRRAFPAAVVEAGSGSGPLWQEAFGTLTWEPDAAPATTSTLFDLASLTKVIATASIAMRLIDRGRLTLDDLVARWIPEWRGEDRADVTIQDLLEHASGLPDWVKLYEEGEGRAGYQRAIATIKLEYQPRSRSLYSDLGFLMLGFILEDAGLAPLDAQFAGIAQLLRTGTLGYNPAKALRDRIAPTEIDEWRGRLIVGEVHDENAYGLGGVAGHAGLFGTAPDVGAFARLVLKTLTTDTGLARHATMTRFTRRAALPTSSRALAWDTMLPTSSCGHALSAAAIGHTGFTGTSLWIDPGRDLYVVLLTNRVHPHRRNEQILALRPALHDAIVAGL